jgi:dephospho-CoA kinase
MQSVRPLRIGLTGGIASGKSAVAGLFAARGVPVIDTDVIARDVVAPGEPALTRVVQEFGREVLDASGGLDRRRMRELVFSDAARRARLEAILHPAILDEMIRRSAQAGGNYQILVIPLLVEGDLAKHVDRLLVVDAMPETQLVRLLQRDAENPQQARAMIAAQASRAARLAQADDVIHNDGTLAELESQVAQLHETYLRLATAGARSG